MYKKKTTKLRYGIDVVEYHNGKYGAPGMKRQRRKKPTPEQMEKVNQYNRAKKVRMKLLHHFEPGDYFATLTCRADERPADMAEAKKWFAAAVRVIRREYKKRGYVLKWIRNIEVGSRGAWHIHVIINRIPDTDLILKKAWPHGKVVSQLLYEQGGYKRLADYITKNERTDSRLAESHFMTSRNLPLPEPEEKVYRRWHTWHTIRVPKGYYVDSDSFREGINPVTGYPYRTYTLLKLEDKKMSRSIMEQRNACECFLCGNTRNLEVHHIFGGPSRKKSEHYGLKVHLCRSCHHETIHGHPNSGDDLLLKRRAQEIFEARYNHSLFMSEFTKNYLDNNGLNTQKW